MHRFALLLVLLFPATAGAQSLDWNAPPVGTRIIYELVIGDQVVDADIEVLGIEEGDIVRGLVTTLGQSAEELSLRGVVNIESASGQFEFDRDAARALWPLEAGKSVTFEGSGTAGGQGIFFVTSLTVEAIEEIETPAGLFLAARIANQTDLTFAGGALALETQQWVDGESGLPVKTSILVSSGGQLMQSVTMTAVEGPISP